MGVGDGAPLDDYEDGEEDAAEGVEPGEGEGGAEEGEEDGEGVEDDCVLLENGLLLKLSEEKRES